jgi:hypothetical protein
MRAALTYDGQVLARLDAQGAVHLAEQYVGETQNHVEWGAELVAERR